VFPVCIEADGVPSRGTVGLLNVSSGESPKGEIRGEGEEMGADDDVGCKFGPKSLSRSSCGLMVIDVSAW